MELVDSSHLDLTQSYINSSVFSDSSQLLESRLSNADMDKMQKENLLSKLLELYQALQNTQKDNQMLRIEKAQLRTQLKNCKSKAEQFIQSNIQAASTLQTCPSNPSQQKLTINQSPVESIQNRTVTPFQSEDENGHEQKINKVFVKTHQRGISNNCISTDHEVLGNQGRYYNTMMNSPTKQDSVKVEIVKRPQIPQPPHKLSFPKNKLNALVVLEREYEEREDYEHETQTLENFESFYCPRREDMGETQRRNAFPQSVSPREFTRTNFTTTVKNTTWTDKPSYSQPFYNQQPQPQYYDQQQQSSSSNTTPTDRQMNKSMSSSSLSNHKYCNSKGFKIPSSIDEIWGTSNNNGGNTQSYMMEKVNGASGKVAKLVKVGAVKGVGVGVQRRTYLNC